MKRGKTGTNQWKFYSYSEAIRRVYGENSPPRLWLFIAAALVTGGLLQIVVPVLADGTPAGTPIENKATGTFEDPNNPGVAIPVESNTVTLTVAEVAGITVQANGVTQTNGNSQIDVGELIYFEYKVTNVGNDPTRFRIPNSATVTGPGTITGKVQISTDGGTTWTDISGAEVITGAIAPAGSILVRVPVTVASGAAINDEIRVQLGQTPNNAQNVERTADNGDVYTEDNPDGAGSSEVAGAPVNGVREASASQTVTVAQIPLALPTLSKTHVEPVASGNPADPKDDVITYQLTLAVRDSIPPGSSGFVPGDLEGNAAFPLNVDGSAVPRILVSDAIPSDTSLVADSWKAPTGWQIVFTADDPANVKANAANWRTDPATLGGVAKVRRIGFIFNGTVAKGTTLAGFEFKVITSGITTSSTIANSAEVFGATKGNPQQLIYDESGDQNPNNFNDDGTQPPRDNTGNPIVGTGVANPQDNGTDPSNNNTGTGPGGEVNVVTIAVTSTTLVNGPQGTAGAVGPTDNNDDFTDKVALIPQNVQPSQQINPDPVNFTNTVENKTGSPATIVPTPPQDPNALPAGTTVTISYGGRSVSYTYNPATGFTSADPPIAIPATESLADYAVAIDLPLSTQNTAYPVPLKAFIDQNSDGKPDAGEPANTTINRVYTGFLKMVKESRVLKGAGPDVLSGQDTFSTDAKTPGPGNIIEFRFTYTNFATAGGQGNVTLSANNLTIAEDGTTYDPASNPTGNNWALDTDNSDSDNNPNTDINTSNVVGSAADSTGGTIAFFSGRPATTPASDKTGTDVNTDVTKYVVTVRGALGPGKSGTFTFRRRVN